MNYIQKKLPIFLFICFTFPGFIFSQNSVPDGLRFEVLKINPPLSISKQTLNEAETLADIYFMYKPSWIKEFFSMEIQTIQNGKVMKAVGKNDILNQEQKDLMKMVDVGTYIKVKVLYLPDNTLANNDTKEIKFSFLVIPEKEAYYTGGEEQLRHYIEEKAINKISVSNFEKSKLASIKFNISEEGQVEDAHVLHSSNDEEIDELLLKSIREMPCWNPAEYSNSVKAKQEFILNVGNLESCLLTHYRILRE
jgi:hypothetical protein